MERPSSTLLTIEAKLSSMRIMATASRCLTSAALSDIGDDDADHEHRRLDGVEVEREADDEDRRAQEDSHRRDGLGEGSDHERDGGRLVGGFGGEAGDLDYHGAVAGADDAARAVARRLCVEGDVGGFERLGDQVALLVLGKIGRAGLRLLASGRRVVDLHLVGGDHANVRMDLRAVLEHDDFAVHAICSVDLHDGAVSHAAAALGDELLEALDDGRRLRLLEEGDDGSDEHDNVQRRAGAEVGGVGLVQAVGDEAWRVGARSGDLRVRVVSRLTMRDGPARVWGRVPLLSSVQGPAPVRIPWCLLGPRSGIPVYQG